MKNEEILSHIDHTLLKATASWAEIQSLCDEAIIANVASVCIPPCYVGAVKEAYGNKLKICTVVGFPLGYSVTSVKVAEATQSIADGADEVDMVINLADVKNGHIATVEAEISALRVACGTKILKVIIETCYLTQEEKVQLCHAVTNAGADFIKTSTGFGTGGATLLDIQLFKKNIGPKVKMKAAGGIKSVADLEAFIAEGCDRIGTSSAVALLRGDTAKSY